MKTLQAVEENLQKPLDAYGVSKKLTMKMVKDWIFNDEGDSAMEATNRFQKKWFKHFAHTFKRDEFNEILQAFVDAWNYFPHKSLNGKSPSQMVERSLKKDPTLGRNDQSKQKMPDVIVGGRKMTWDAYSAMLAEMEKLQIPFRSWVKNDLLPKYKKFLEAGAGTKTVEKHYEVADIFLERAMHVGFITLDEIRKDFIQTEFPKWWQTHVLMSSMQEREVLSSLHKLFRFIAVEYNKDVKKFGF